MSLKLCVILIYACLFFGITATANATNVKNPVIKKEIIRKPSELSAFVERILLEHPAILSAQADIDIAKARVEGSEKPLYNPELEIEAEDAGVLTYTLGMTQTIDWHDKRSTRFDEAELLLQTAKANLVSVKEQVAGEIMKSTVRYLSRRDMNVVARSRVKLIERFFELVKNRQEAGDVGQLEVGTAQLILTSAIIQHAEIGSSLINALGDFKKLTGVGTDLSMSFPTELPSSLSKNIDLKMFAAQHPLVLAAQMKVEASKARIRTANRERRADPSLGVTAGTEDNETLVSLHFSLPLQVRNNYRSEVIAINHEAIKDEQHARNVYRQVLARIETTKSQYVVMSNAMNFWVRKGRNALNSHLQNLEKLWKTGEISTTQYLIQVQQTLDTQLSGAKLKGDVWQAWIDWLVATGSITKWITSLK